MNQSRDFYLYTLNEKAGNRCLASPVPENLIQKNGLPAEAIAGEFTEGAENTSEETFKQNPLFLQFLHWVLAKHIRQCPGFIAQAKQKADGQVLIVDLRSSPINKDVPRKDILAVVDIKDGQAVKFHGLKDYKVFTESGFTRVDPWLHDKVVEELRSLIESGKSPLQASRG